MQLLSSATFLTESCTLCNPLNSIHRSVEVLEKHFEAKGSGVLSAVQARLSRRQLPRLTEEGLVEYSLQVGAKYLEGFETSVK